MIIKCIVSTLNSNGEPDLFFVKVEGTEEQIIENAEHLNAAKDEAAEQGHEPYLVYDEKDSAGSAMLPLMEWDSASVVSI